MFLHYQVMEKLESDCHSSLSNLLMYLHNISKNFFPFFSLYTIDKNCCFGWGTGKILPLILPKIHINLWRVYNETSYIFFFFQLDNISNIFFKCYFCIFCFVWILFSFLLLYWSRKNNHLCTQAARTLDWPMSAAYFINKNNSLRHATFENVLRRFGRFKPSH